MVAPHKLFGEDWEVVINILPTNKHFFLCCSSGLLIRALADASHERRSLSASQIICNVVGFFATVAVTITVTIYAKRRLKQLHKEEEVLLR